MKHVGRVLPSHLVNGTIGLLSACAGIGVALISLLAGSVFSKWGVEILQPLCVFQSLHSLVTSPIYRTRSFERRLAGVLLTVP